MIFLTIAVVLLSLSTPTSIALDNVAIGVGLLGLILSYKRLRLSDIDYRVLGVSGVGFVSSILSYRPIHSLNNAHYLWHFLPYFISSRVDRKKIRLVLILLGIAAIVSAFAVIFQAFTGIKINHAHLSDFMNIHFFKKPHYYVDIGLFSNSLTTAGILAPISLLFISVSVFEKDVKLRFYYLLVSFLLFVALLLTLKRTYWLGFLVALLLSPFIYFRSKSFRAIVLTILTVSVLSYFFIKPVHNSFQAVIHYSKSESAINRIALWQAGIDLYKDYNIKNKLIGCGSGNLFHYVKPYMIKRVRMAFPHKKDIMPYVYSSVHNEYLQILLKWGVVGLVVWLYLWGYVLYRNVVFIRKTDSDFYRGVAIGLTMGFIAFLVGGFFEHNVGDAEVIISVMFLLGLDKNILDSLGEAG